MRNSLFIIFVVFIQGGFAQATQDGLDYIEKYREIAISEMYRAKIPASITLAQGIHESNFGKSVLAKNSNNHFGIKCHKDWTGKEYRHDDDAPQECFRVYDLVAESYRDHSDFLVNRKWYLPLFRLPINDYKEWARGLKAAGYATNPKYPEILIKIIEDYDLQKLDDPTLTPNTFVPPASENIPTDNSQPVSPIFISEIVLNGCRALIYDGTTSLSTIEKQYHVSMTDLHRWNDLKPTNHFKEGDYIFLESKKEEAEYSLYEMEAKESLWAVSQRFGVSLQSLCKRNSVHEKAEIAAGELLYLKGKRTNSIKLEETQKVTEKPKANQAKNKKYVVKKSDTLYSIAKSHNLEVEELMQLNKLKSESLYIGQILKIF